MASSGRQALRLALGSPDYELAFIDTTIDDPVAELLVQQFRHDAARHRCEWGAGPGGSIARRSGSPTRTPWRWPFLAHTRRRPSPGR